MSDTALSDPNAPARDARRSPPAAPLIAWARRVVSTALVAAGLVGVVVWGHRTDWTFVEQSHPPAAPPVDDGGLGRVRLGGPLPPRAEAPTALRREVAIEFDSARMVDELGIAIAPVWVGEIADTVAAPGEVGFDPARVTRVVPRAAGSVWRVSKRPGDPVTAGEVIALVEAPGAGKAKVEFQQAIVEARLRATTLADLRAAAKAVSAQLVREAEAAVAAADTRLLAAAQALADIGLSADPADYRDLAPDAAAARLRLIGVPRETPGLDPKSATANLIPVRAPFAGVVLSADAVAGEAADPGRPLFVVVDPARVRVTLHVPTGDAHRVAAGQPLRFRPDGAAEDAAGVVGGVGRAAADLTRTVPVWADLPNDVGRLRAGTLGQGRVVVRREAKAVLVPHDAVRTFRGHPVVFVRDTDFLKPGGPKAFHARPVRVGARDAENTEVLAGLRAGEVVATAGGELLLNELARAAEPAGHRTHGGKP